MTDAGLPEVAAEMADELGGAPTLAEFLEVLGWSLPADSPLPQPLRFTATLAGRRKYRSETESRVGNLDDSVFEDAREHLAASAADAEQLAAAVLEELRSGRVILSDVEPADLGGLTAETPKKVTKPKPGDVVAIPAAGSGHRMAVVLGRNRFGTALGLFDGVSPQGRLGRLRDAPKYPVYTDESLLKNGAWRVVDHDESLLDLFPADPPIYHRPNAWPGIDTGEHGAAETADGTVTPISEDEARKVGLADGSYRATLHAAFLQKQLDDGKI